MCTKHVYHNFVPARQDEVFIWQFFRPALARSYKHSMAFILPTGSYKQALSVICTYCVKFILYNFESDIVNTLKDLHNFF